jgi:hypothetical protein
LVQQQISTLTEYFSIISFHNSCTVNRGVFTKMG